MFSLILRKKSNIKFSHTFNFVQRTITVGKDVSNNLRLYSRDRSVSRIHAEIYGDRDNFFIVDKGSGSGTYIENLKLVQNRSYLLNEGTQINIGEYHLTFLINPPQDYLEKSEKKMINTTISFLEDELAYLDDLRRKDTTLYDDKIQNNLHRVLDSSQNKNLRSLLKQNVGTGINVQVKKNESHSDKTDFIVDMFLKLFVEFHSMSNKISNEFIDSHIVHRRDSKQLVFPDSLKNYILSTELSTDEKNNRINFLWNEIEDLISKHWALFAGYRSSIKYGARDLLKELDPAKIINNKQEKSIHFKSGKILNRYLPFLIKHRNVLTIIEKYESLSKNIDKEIELKYFQPAFKNGYLQKVNSDNQSDYDLNH
jgi:pSer/pThr/pTyr-binding forkhead associated (FHA) protein